MNIKLYMGPNEDHRQAEPRILPRGMILKRKEKNFIGLSCFSAIETFKISRRAPKSGRKFSTEIAQRRRLLEFMIQSTTVSFIFFSICVSVRIFVHFKMSLLILKFFWLDLILAMKGTQSSCDRKILSSIALI